MRIEAYKEEKAHEVRVCESAVKQQLFPRPFFIMGGDDTANDRFRTLQLSHAHSLPLSGVPPALFKRNVQPEKLVMCTLGNLTFLFSAHPIAK